MYLITPQAILLALYHRELKTLRLISVKWNNCVASTVKILIWLLVDNLKHIMGAYIWGIYSRGGAFKSVTYGMNSITNICLDTWNSISEILEKPSTLSISELKKMMFEMCITKYWFYGPTWTKFFLHWLLPPPPLPLF